MSTVESGEKIWLGDVRYKVRRKGISVVSHKSMRQPGNAKVSI